MKKGGYFEGLAYHEWTIEKREFRLLRDLVFIDTSGARWCVPKGAVIGRTKFPRCFRRWLADPFCAKMRRATAVHFYFSECRIASSAAVNRMFRQAMKADGVPWRQRVAVYWWLRSFGAQWEGGTCP